MNEVAFCFEERIRRSVKAYADVPDDVFNEGEDAIIYWLLNNPAEWRDESTIDEDVGDHVSESLELLS
jgi:hypothetical protein